MSEELLSWWSAFHFLRPWWLLLLLLPIVFYGRYFYGRNNHSSWEKVVDQRLLGYLLIKGSSASRELMAWLGLIGICTAIIAAAGPSWVKQEIPALAPENPVMMVLNLSSDMKGRDLTPSRLERAKFMIRDMLEAMKGTQTGLEVYSSEPFLISPLTEDQQILINLLPAVNYDIMPANGDRLDRAIALAAEKMQAAGFGRGQIMVFTPDVGQRLDLAIDAAKKAAAAGFRVNIIGVSAKTNEKLKLASQAGNGDYFLLASDQEQIMAQAIAMSKTATPLTESKNWQTIWLDYGYYLLVVPLLCCLYFFRKGILVIVLLLAAQPAQAGFFLNDNQEGLEAFSVEDYQTAAQKFRDANWQAATAYRLGNYEEAYQLYAGKDDTIAFYNQGNALAKSGKIEEAIKKYEDVLKREPNHEDAKFNLEYLKRQQQEQQEQQQEKQDQNKDQDQQQNQSQQNQSQDQNKNEQSGENKQEQKQKQEQQSQSDGQSQPEEKPQEQPGQPQPQPQPMSEQEQKAEPQPQEQQQAGGVQKEGDEPKYDEQMQAKAQQYREIPEDPGGLLKAFIYREYGRNRYNDK